MLFKRVKPACNVILVSIAPPRGITYDLIERNIYLSWPYGIYPDKQASDAIMLYRLKSEIAHQSFLLRFTIWMIASSCCFCAIASFTISCTNSGCAETAGAGDQDRKSTRLNSSHQIISYAVFCLKKKKNTQSTNY